MEEVIDLDQGMAHGHAHEGAVVCEGDHAAAGWYLVAIDTKTALEINVRRRERGGRAFPLAALVGLDLQVTDRERQEVPVHVQRLCPVELQRVELRNHRVGVGQQGRIHHDQGQIDVVQRDAHTVRVKHLLAIHQTVAVGIDEVRTGAGKNIDVRETQGQRLNLQVFNTAVVAREPIDLGQAGFQRSIHARCRVVGRQSGSDIHVKGAGHFHVEATADVDVVGDRQRGATNLDAGQRSLGAIKIQCFADPGTCRHLQWQRGKINHA